MIKRNKVFLVKLSEEEHNALLLTADAADLSAQQLMRRAFSFYFEKGEYSELYKKNIEVKQNGKK